ncbi:MAG: hypothetical protein HY934_03900 [Candidatus Firestonebacteria bacterium]|nr:hypothetical protein [Candidatus Firestonebacteria bacterium]
MLYCNKLVKYILFVFVFISIISYKVKGEEIPEGEILWMEENFVFINLGNKHKLHKNMVLDVYDKKNKVIGVIEVTSVIEDSLSMARAYMQMVKIKKGYKVRPQSARAEKKSIEIPLSEVAIKVKKADLIKTFSSFVYNVGVEKEKINIDDFQEVMYEDLFERAISTLKINIPNMVKDENKTILIKRFKAEDFINIISKELIFNGQNHNIFYRAEVNISRLIEKLKENGYVLRAKRIIIELPGLNQFETRDIVKELSSRSLFLGEEIIDNQSPIPIVVYTTPKLFASEILKFSFIKYKITLDEIKEDTIKLLVEKL